MSEKKDFIVFIKDNHNSFLKTCQQISGSCCSEMNDNDNRFDIGKMFARGIKKAYPNLFQIHEVDGYDILYIPTQEKISLKSMKRMFQRRNIKKNNGSLNKPFSIILKNFMYNGNGDEKVFVKLDCDYLVSVQRSGKIKFGVVDIKKCFGSCTIQKTSVLLNLKDEEYDFLSDELDEECFLTNEEYKKIQELKFDMLLREINQKNIQ